MNNFQVVLYFKFDLFLTFFILRFELDSFVSTNMFQDKYLPLVNQVSMNQEA